MQNRRKRGMTFLKRTMFLLWALCLLFAASYGSVWAESFHCNAGKHDYAIEIKTQATKEEDGEKIYTCQICSFSFSKKIPATGHTWGKWKTEKAPTCTKQGSEFRICIRHENDNHRQKRPISAMGHVYEEKTVASTCEKEGVMREVCSRCGTIGKEQILSATGHLYIETVIEEPSCEEKGKQIVTCDRCGDNRTVPIPAWGHNYGEWITELEATEEQEGYRRKICSHDKTHYLEETLPKRPLQAPHSFPDKIDILFFVVVLSFVTGFGISIYRDAYVLRWEKKKSMTFAEWQGKNKRNW